jgi:hypothetical protein
MKSIIRISCALFLFLAIACNSIIAMDDVAALVQKLQTYLDAKDYKNGLALYKSNINALKNSGKALLIKNQLLILEANAKQPDKPPKEEPAEWIFVKAMPPGTPDASNKDWNWRIVNEKLELNVSSEDPIEQKSYKTLIDTQQKIQKPYILAAIKEIGNPYYFFIDGRSMIRLMPNQINDSCYRGSFPVCSAFGGKNPLTNSTTIDTIDFFIIAAEIDAHRFYHVAHLNPHILPTTGKALFSNLLKDINIFQIIQTFAQTMIFPTNDIIDSAKEMKRRYLASIANYEKIYPTGENRPISVALSIKKDQEYVDDEEKKIAYLHELDMNFDIQQINKDRPLLLEQGAKINQKKEGSNQLLKALHDMARSLISLANKI